PATASVDYTADDYPQSLPFLTGNDYSALQGMHTGSAFDVHFSPFATGGQANDSFIFFTIFDPSTNSFVFDAGFLPATAAGLTLPANLLKPNHAYIYELIFSNRDLVPSTGTVFASQLGFDFRTRGG